MTTERNHMRDLASRASDEGYTGSPDVEKVSSGWRGASVVHT